MLKRSLIAFFLIGLAGAGCVPQTVQRPNQTIKSAKEQPAWVEIAVGVERYDCPTAFCGDRLIVYRFEKNRYSWRFDNRATPATVEAWAKSLPNASFVVNGVYFDENDQPTGLLKTSGKLVNDRSYDLSKSAVFELAPIIDVIDTSLRKIDTAAMTEAAQGFPLLIKNGSPVPEFKDTHAARRSFIGTDKKGDVYVGAIPEDTITFADLSKLLSTLDVKWNYVLNLDGGTSTGFAARVGNFNETMNSIVQVPNVIIAEKK